MLRFSNKLIAASVGLALFSGCMTAQNDKPVQDINQLKTPQQKMKIEIWSDVMCPFCYIGKRRFEAALEQFPQKNNVEVVWKSFQLNPAMKTDPSKSTVQYLAETKGWTMEYTRKTIEYVTDMAKGVGLHYDFDRAVVANSFDAHRLIQFAKTKGKGDAAEEQLFKAYFTEGKNTADHAVLMTIGSQIGLDPTELKTVLESSAYSEEVKQDVSEAELIGVQGVPFFVIDRKYGVSGAQESKTFVDALTKAWSEHQKNNLVNLSSQSSGASCTPEGECK